MIISTDTAYAVSNPGMKRYTMQTLTAVTIPAGTTSIDGGAYLLCPMTSVVIPTSVTIIGFLLLLLLLLIIIIILLKGGIAFHGCAQLASVTIPDSVTSIG